VIKGRSKRIAANTPLAARISVLVIDAAQFHFQKQQGPTLKKADASWQAQAFTL